MSSRPPVVRQISWPLLLPQLIALIGIILITNATLKPESYRGAAILGAVIYLTYSIASRQLIPRAHRRGIRLFRAERFADAIAEFEASYHFFQRYSWLDRYRSLTMMSPSAMSYREMALLNIAFCYGQIGEGAKSQHYYEQTSREFPNSSMAKAALNIIRAVKEKKEV